MWSVVHPQALRVAAEIGRDPHLVQTILQEQINALLNEVADQFEGPVTTI